MHSSLLYDRIAAGAAAHGAADEPDHETGDLLRALELALELMTPDQRSTLAAKPEVLGIITAIGPNDPSEVNQVEGNKREYLANLHDHYFQPCYRVEYDLGYSGGDYNRVGAFAYVPAALVEKLGSVAEAFRAHTGHDPVHMVHFSEDERFAADGVQIR